MELKELAQQIEVKGVELQDAFKRARECKDGDGVELANEINKREAELAGLEKDYQAKRAIEEAERKNAARLEMVRGAIDRPSVRREEREERAEGKSIGDMFGDLMRAELQAKGLPSLQPGMVFSLKGVNLRDAQFKTVLTTSGYAPQSIRTGMVVDYATRRPMVQDIIPIYTSDQNAFVYMEETTFTNNAGATAQGSAATESAFAWTERSKPHEEIVATVPVSNVALADIANLAARINQRLKHQLDLALETQLMTGDGSTPNLTGLHTAVTQSQAKGSDSVPDAIYKGFTKVRHTGFGEPSAVILHPNDWEPVRLLTTADGIYIWGSPSEAGPETIWGKPAVITTAATEGTGLVGDFAQFAELSYNGGLQIEIGYNNDDIKKRQKTIVMTQRAALAVTRIAAFCEITGI